MRISDWMSVVCSSDLQRNAWNFTRGSQLLTHELLMWFSGARLPLILWFFLFVAAWLIIMSIKLDEHGFQLVCMKIYSAFWGWVDLDPAKRVNVTLPTGEIERTRSEEHTSELQSLMRISYAVLCLKKKKSKN